VVVDVGAGVARIGDAVLRIRPAPGGLAVGDVVLRPLRFGERMRLVAGALASPGHDDDGARALAAAVLRAASDDGPEPEESERPAVEALALHLAGARLGTARPPGFATCAGLLSRALGWGASEVVDVEADLADRLAGDVERSLAGMDDGGWTRIVLSEGSPLGTGAPQPVAESAAQARDLLARDLLHRGRAPFVAATDAGGRLGLRHGEPDHGTSALPSQTPASGRGPGAAGGPGAGAVPFPEAPAGAPAGAGAPRQARTPSAALAAGHRDATAGDDPVRAELASAGAGFVEPASAGSAFAQPPFAQPPFAQPAQAAGDAGRPVPDAGGLPRAGAGTGRPRPSDGWGATTAGVPGSRAGRAATEAPWPDPIASAPAWWPGRGQGVPLPDPAPVAAGGSPAARRTPDSPRTRATLPGGAPASTPAPVHDARSHDVATLADHLAALLDDEADLRGIRS
jgi:hypothetical protein